MGDLALDTAGRRLGDGRFEATLSRDWEIWGPNGGDVAAVALRAAGAAAGPSRPAAVDHAGGNVSVHRPSPDAEWLLVDGTAPVSTGGLVGWTGRVWPRDGRLHASGCGQCPDRRVPG